MPVSDPVGEDRRLALLSRLIDVLGEEEANTLMQCLPPTSWGQLATKDDMRAARDDRRAMEERLRTEFNGQFVQVQAQFVQVQAQFTALTAEVNGEFATVSSEFTNLRGEMALQFAKQTRTLVFMLAGFAVTIWGSMLAVGLS